MRFRKLLSRILESPFGRFLKKYHQDNVPLHATAIAYNAILSMFPIILALLAIMGLFLRDEQNMQSVSEAIIRVLPADAEADALKVVQASRTESGLLGIISFVGLLWGGSALFDAMSDAFNHVLGLPNRGFLQQKLMAFAMIFVFAFLMLFSLAASSVATLLLSVSQEATGFAFPELALLETFSAWLTSLLLSFLLFLSLYWIVPNRSFSFRQVWPGALLAAILFFLIVQIWPIYLTFIGQFNRFDAVFGLFLLLMTWFLFLAQIVMLGVELNAFLLQDGDASTKDTKRHQERLTKL